MHREQADIRTPIFTSRTLVYVVDRQMKYIVKVHRNNPTQFVTYANILSVNLEALIIQSPNSLNYTKFIDYASTSGTSQPLHPVRLSLLVSVRL